MKKLLYVNNYGADLETFERVKNGEYPRSHLWGMYELLLETGRGGIVMITSPCLSTASRFCRLIKTLRFQISLYMKYRKTPVVYAASAHQIDVFALMKKLHLYSGKLFCVIHHPSKVPLAQAYEKIICISTYTQNYLKDNGCKNTEYVFWGADLPFYKDDTASPEKVYDFYSNGKSFRDFALIKKLTVPYKMLVLASDGDNTGTISFKYRVSDRENVMLCKQSRVMFIPVCKEVHGIVGLTSVADAIALGMPILMSDSAHIGIDVEKLGIGLEYKAGDKDDCERKMKLILQEEIFDSMSKNSEEFGKKYDYDAFATRIQSLLRTALEEKSE